MGRTRQGHPIYTKEQGIFGFAEEKRILIRKGFDYQLTDIWMVYERIVPSAKSINFGIKSTKNGDMAMILDRGMGSGFVCTGQCSHCRMNRTVNQWKKKIDTHFNLGELYVVSDNLAYAIAGNGSIYPVSKDQHGDINIGDELNVPRLGSLPLGAIPGPSRLVAIYFNSIHDINLKSGAVTITPLPGRVTEYGTDFSTKGAVVLLINGILHSYSNKKVRKVCHLEMDSTSILVKI